MNGKFIQVMMTAAAVVVYILLSCEGTGCDAPSVGQQGGTLFDQFMNLWEIG
jgi:hypothetical protein